jgi:ABC-type sugar transport system substrate-binding protein
MTHRARIAGRPVTKLSFEFLKKWVDTHENEVKDIDPESKGANFLTLIAAYFENLEKSEPLDEDQPVDVAPAFLLGPEPYELGTVKIMAVPARKLLGLASKRLGFDKVASVVQQGAQFFLLWKEPKAKTPGPAGPDIKRVTCFWDVWGVWPGSFLEDYLRGMDAMADALGIQFDTFPVPFKHEGSMIAAVRDYVEEQRPDPKTHALILDLGNPSPVRNQLFEVIQEGFHVVTTGHAGSTVSQDNTAMGRLVAEAVKKDLKKDERASPVILVAKTRSYPGGPGVDQVESLRAAFHKGDVDVDPLDCKLDLDDAGRVNDGEARQLLRERLKKKDASRIRAVVVQSCELAAAAIEVMAALGLTKAKAVPVYAIGISGEMLALMRRTDSPIRLVVGNDAFHYGRVVLRAASVRGERSMPPLKPVVVTQEDVQSASPPLGSMCDLARVKSGADVKLKVCDDGWFGRR